MQTTVTRKNSHTLSIEIKESGAEFVKAKNAVIDTIRKEGKVKGFKKGSQIPEEVILREFGAQAIEQQALDTLIEKLYPKILKKEQIIPVAPGNVVAVRSMQPVDITIEVEVLPEIEIDTKKLDAIKIKRTKPKVTAAEVDAEVEAIKARFTHFHEAGVHAEDGADTSNTTVENGDRVTITAQGYTKKGGDAIPETAVPSYPLVIGSGAFIPGFEEKLIGAKVGDEVAFDITFPKDYHSEEFKGRKVHFTASVEKLEKPHTPEFTEEFIEKLRGEKTDLEGLKKILKNEITLRKENEARQKDENALMKEMLAITDFSVGDALLAGEVDQIFREHAANLEQQGLSIKDYLQHIRLDEATYKEQTVKPEAERRLKAELLLRKIREIRKTEVSEKEVQKEIDAVIAQYSSPEVVERLKAKLVPGDAYYEDIKNRLVYRTIVDSFWE